MSDKFEDTLKLVKAFLLAIVNVFTAIFGTTIYEKVSELLGD